MDKEPLYRVRVLITDPKTDTDRPLDLGPALIKEAAMLCRDAIEKNIRAGKEKVWHDPIIYPIYT